MNDHKKKYLSKKYNLPINKLYNDHLSYYYDRVELCCQYNLQPIEKINPFEFDKCLQILSSYYQDIHAPYYKNLYQKVKKYGNDLDHYQSRKLKDRVMLEYLKFRPQTYFLTLWHFITNEHIEKLRKYLLDYGIVYDVKKISLTYKAAMNLIYQLYSDTHRFHTIAKIKEKLEYLKWKEGEKKDIHVLIFENTSNFSLSGSQSVLKTKIRNYLLENFPNQQLRGDDLVHINDHYYQTIEYAKIFLQTKSLFFLHHQNLEGYLSKDFENCRLYINTLKKWMIENVHPIDYERFVLMGSSVLYTYGIRSCRDIDGLVSGVPFKAKTPDLIKKLAQNFYEKSTKFFFADLGIIDSQYWKPQWDEKDASWFKLLKIKDRDELIFNPEYHYYFNGLKFISLKSELIRKFIRRRYYDYGDILQTKHLVGITITLPQVPKDINKNELISQIKAYFKEKYKLTELESDKLLEIFK
jgi:hypothetical protein